MKLIIDQIAAGKKLLIGKIFCAIYIFTLFIKAEMMMNSNLKFYHMKMSGYFTRPKPMC